MADQQLQDEIIKLLDALPGAVLLINRDAEIVFANSQMLDCVQCNDNQVIGQRLSSIFPVYQKQLFNDHWSLAAIGAPISSKMQLHKADGSIQRVDTRASPVILGDRQLMLFSIDPVQSIPVDPDERFRKLAHTAPDAIVSISKDGKIGYWNPSAEKLFGYSEDEILGQSVGKLVPDRYKDSFLSKVVTWSNGESAFDGPFELFGIDKEGNELIGQCAFSRWEISGGIHFTAFIRDVTELRKWQRIIDHIFQGTVAHTGNDFFGSLVQHLAVALNIEFSMVTRLISFNDNVVESVASICHSEPQTPFQYLTSEAPCAPVLSGDFVCFQRDLCTLYPEFTKIVDMPLAQGYLAAPLIGSREQILGHLVIIDSKPIEGDLKHVRAILSVFAARAAAEMERLQLDKENQLLLHSNQLLARESLTTQEEERRYLRQELHDELGQSLTAIQAYTEIISSTVTDIDSSVHESAVAIDRITRQVFSAVRMIMDRLRPALLDDLGLEASLDQMIEEWRTQHPDKHCSIKITGNLEEIGQNISITLYRIAQECLTNVSRHSNASVVRILLDYVERTQRGEPGRIRMTVVDNGCGDTSENSCKFSIGIIGMSERAKALGGTLEVTNEKNQGFRIDVDLPVVSSITTSNGELH